MLSSLIFGLLLTTAFCSGNNHTDETSHYNRIYADRNTKKTEKNDLNVLTVWNKYFPFTKYIKNFQTNTIPIHLEENHFGNNNTTKTHTGNFNAGQACVLNWHSNNTAALTGDHSDHIKKAQVNMNSFKPLDKFLNDYRNSDKTKTATDLERGLAKSSSLEERENNVIKLLDPAKIYLPFFNEKKYLPNMEQNKYKGNPFNAAAGNYFQTQQKYDNILGMFTSTVKPVYLYQSSIYSSGQLNNMGRKDEQVNFWNGLNMNKNVKNQGQSIYTDSSLTGNVEAKNELENLLKGYSKNKNLRETLYTNRPVTQADKSNIGTYNEAANFWKMFERSQYPYLQTLPSQKDVSNEKTPNNFLNYLLRFYEVKSRKNNVHENSPSPEMNANKANVWNEYMKYLQSFYKNKIPSNQVRNVNSVSSPMEAAVQSMNKWNIRTNNLENNFKKMTLEYPGEKPNDYGPSTEVYNGKKIQEDTINVKNIQNTENPLKIFLYISDSTEKNENDNTPNLPATKSEGCVGRSRRFHEVSKNKKAKKLLAWNEFMEYLQSLPKTKTRTNFDNENCKYRRSLPLNTVKIEAQNTSTICVRNICKSKIPAIREPNLCEKTSSKEANVMKINAWNEFMEYLQSLSKPRRTEGNKRGGNCKSKSFSNPTVSVKLCGSPDDTTKINVMNTTPKYSAENGSNLKCPAEELDKDKISLGLDLYNKNYFSEVSTKTDDWRSTLSYSKQDSNDHISIPTTTLRPDIVDIAKNVTDPDKNFYSNVSANEIQDRHDVNQGKEFHPINVTVSSNKKKPDDMTCGI